MAAGNCHAKFNWGQLSWILAHFRGGQMAGWIKMPLGRKIGFDPSNILLDGDPAPPPQKGAAQTAGWIKMPVGMKLGLGPGHVVLDGDPATGPPKGEPLQFSAHVRCVETVGWINIPANYRPMPIVAKRSPISATAEHL